MGLIVPGSVGEMRVSNQDGVPGAGSLGPERPSIGPDVRIPPLLVHLSRALPAPEEIPHRSLIPDPKVPGGDVLRREPRNDPFGKFFGMGLDEIIHPGRESFKDLLHIGREEREDLDGIFMGKPPGKIPFNALLT